VSNILKEESAFPKSQHTSVLCQVRLPGIQGSSQGILAYRADMRAPSRGRRRHMKPKKIFRTHLYLLYYDFHHHFGRSGADIKKNNTSVYPTFYFAASIVW
jgi:hypothetical protein